MSQFLVTGGAGFIGRALCSYLLKKHHQVVVVDNLVGGTLPIEGVEFIHGDIADPGTYRFLSSYRFAGVFHLAASFANEKSVEHVALDCKSNIAGTVELLTWLASTDSGVPMVYTGSSSSYGDQPVPFTGSTPASPSTPYGLSKYVGEQYVGLIHPNSVILRLFNVFGPGDIPGKWRNAIPNMTARGLRDKTITVFGENATRDFTYIDDVVAILYNSWERSEELRGKTINLCSGEETSIVSLAKVIAFHLRNEHPESQFEINVKSLRPWDKVVRRVGDSTEVFDLFGHILNSDGKFYSRMKETVRWVLDYCHKNEFSL